MPATLERGRVVKEGMGGFLNPPGHPEHDYHVQTDLRRRPENRGGMSLSTAVDCDYLDAGTRAAARAKLAQWAANKQPLESPEVQAWIRQVLGYFAGAYRRAGNDAPDAWHVHFLIFNKHIDPMMRLEDHAGVHLIQSFYPEFKAEPIHFAQARWGDVKPASTDHRAPHLGN